MHCTYRLGHALHCLLYYLAFVQSYFSYIVFTHNTHILC